MSLRRSGRASKGGSGGTSPPVTSSDIANATTAKVEALEDSTPSSTTAERGGGGGGGKRKRTTTSPNLIPTPGTTGTRIKLVRNAAAKAEAAAAAAASQRQPTPTTATPATGKKKPGRPKGKGKSNRWAKRAKKADSINGTAASPEEEEADEEEADESLEVGDTSGEIIVESNDSKIKGALDLVHHPVQVKHAVELKEEVELWLLDEEREQLQVVMRAFMPALLQVAGEIVKAPFATLAEALDGRQVKLRDVRNHVVSLRRQAQQSREQSHDKAASEALIRAHTLLISLLDSLATTRRALDTSLIASTSSTLSDSPALQQQQHGPSSTKRKVALHMTLPQGHYFSSAAAVHDSVTLNAGCADVVSVVPAAEPARAKSPVPLLGERVYGGTFKPKQNVRLEGEVHKPAAHLYYNAYASFAPTHDTADATLSLGATRLLWDNKRRVRDSLRERGWGSSTAPVSAEGGSISEIAQPPTAPASDVAFAKQQKQHELTNKDFEALHPDLDAEQLARAYETLEQEMQVDVRLRASAVRLAQLQRAQEARLRRAFGTGSEKGEPSGDGAEPNDEERELARQVLQGLAELVQLRPKAVTIDAAGEALQLSLIPPPSRLRAAAHSAAIDPALLNGNDSSVIDAGYWGTLDEAVFGPEAARRRKAVEVAAAGIAAPHGRGVLPLGNAPAPAAPSVIADNEVLRLVPAAAARVQAQLSAKGSLVGAAARRGGKQGLLERVAETRGYTPQHAHAADVAFVRPSLANAHHLVGTPGATSTATPAAPQPAQQRGPPSVARASMPPATTGTATAVQQAEFAAHQAALHARQAALVRPAPLQQAQQQQGHYPSNMNTPQHHQRTNGQASQSYAAGSGSGTPGGPNATPGRQTLGFYPTSTPRPLSHPQAQQQPQPAGWRPPPQQQRAFAPPSHSQQHAGLGMGTQQQQHALWLQQQAQAQAQAQLQKQPGSRR